MDKLSIVFMGTPEFAVGILEEILKHPKIEVKAVVTMPDKASGRGQKVHESAVKQFAVAQHIPVLQPEKLRSPEFITQLQGINADCFVVVAFRMLPEMVWAMPQKGTLNLHASLLPQYRGAAPINWVIINGEKETGVTTFFIEKEIDTGSIILQEKVTISEVMTAGELHDELKSIGAKLVVKTLEDIRNNNIKPIPQTELAQEELKAAPKIFKEDCKIDWSKSGKAIVNHIRGLSPYPAAFTELDGLSCKIFRANFEASSHKKALGSYETDGKSTLHFFVKDGIVHIQELQLEGKKRMKTDEFLRGYRFKSGNSAH